jgi:hypothetical protein
MIQKWHNSSADQKLKDGIRYKGWFEDFIDVINETREISCKISCEIKNSKKYEWKARVPKCGDICGIFVTNIVQFIEESVKWRLRRLSIK